MLKTSLKIHVVVALALSILVAAVYAPIANLSFLSDDFGFVKSAALPDGGTNWAWILDTFHGPVHGEQAMLRPLYALSWGLDYSLYGTKPLGYHLTNLALHAVNSFLVYLVALELVSGEKRRATAVSAGALFALHPVHPEAVTWVSGRVDVICAVFYLSSLVLFLRLLRTRRTPYLIGSLAAFVLALLSKEMAVVLPGLLFLCAVYKRGKVTDAALAVVPFAIILGAYFMFRSYALNGIELTTNVGAAELQIAKVLPGSLYWTLHLFVPLNLGLLPSGWIMPAHSALSLLWPVPLAAAVAIAAWCYFGRNREKLPVLLLALYAVSLAPVFKGLFPSPFLTSSRWLYIPSAFVSILIAYFVWAVFARRRYWAPVATTLICAAFFVILLANNGPYLRAGELAQAQLESGKAPDYPLRYKGAYAFLNPSPWKAANSPPFEEP